MKAILFLVAGVALFVLAGGRAAGSPPEGAEEAQNLTQQQILSATVMIAITTPNWQEEAVAADEVLPIPNDEYRTIAKANGDVVADGLGTLIANEEGVLLVTHDHWSRFDDALGTVTFRTAAGTGLGEMKLRDFKALIRSRDRGTMVLDAPDVLQSAVTAAEATLQPKDLQPGNHGYVARRSGDSVVVSEVNVIAQAQKQGLPVVQLQNMDGQVIVGGDSGGGVWLNGQLTAVMWTTVMMENSTTGVQRATDMSVAAIYQGVQCSVNPELASS